MLKFLIPILLAASSSQTIGPVQETVLSSDSITAIDLNENQLYVFSKKSFYQYDLNNDLLIQNQTLTFTIDTSNTFKLNSQYMIMGINYNSWQILRTDLGKIDSNKITSFAQSYINCIELLDHNQIIVGTTSGAELWDLLTVKRLQSLIWSEVYQFQRVNSSLFILYIDSIEKRDLLDLNTLYETYYTQTSYSDPFITMLFKNDFMFIGHYRGLIQQIDWQTKQEANTFKNHTGLLTSMVILNDYLFSGCWDSFWIQWHIESAQLIRKVITGGFIYKMLIYDSYLLTAGNGGIRKYLIPELSNVISTSATPSSLAKLISKTSKITTLIK